MIKILKNKKIIFIEDLNIYLEKYKNIHFDLGTGTGKYPYSLALDNPETLYIAVDPVMDNMIKYEKISRRNIKKGGVENLIFLVSSLENMDLSIENIANSISIILPWGTLLEGIVKAEESIINPILRLAKNKALLNIYFSYSSLHEPNEIVKRELPILDEQYFKFLKEKYLEIGIEILTIEELTNIDLNIIASSWARRLKVSKERNIFHFKCIVNP